MVIHIWKVQKKGYTKFGTTREKIVCWNKNYYEQIGASQIDLREGNPWKQPVHVGTTLCFTATEHNLTSCEIIRKVFLLYELVFSILYNSGHCLAYDFSSPRRTFIFLVTFIRRCRRRRCRRYCHLCRLCCAFFFTLLCDCVCVWPFFLQMMENANKPRRKECVWMHHTQCASFVYFKMFVQTNVSFFIHSIFLFAS